MKVKELPNLIMTLTHNLDFATDGEINAELLTKFRNYEYLFSDNVDNTECLKAVINEWAPYVNELFKTTQYEYDPIENYNRLEEYSGTDITTYGRKDSRETSIKEAMETDIRTEHNVDTKSAVNAGMKTEHSRDETRSPNTVDTTVHSDSGYDNANGSESSRDVLTRGGSENINSPALTNYDQTTGDELDNFTHNTADALDNYDRNVGSKTDNYRETTGDAAHNYNEASGSDTLGKQYRLTAKGNIGTMSTQQMIQMERDVIINVLAFYIEKFSKCFNIKADGLYSELARFDW